MTKRIEKTKIMHRVVEHGGVLYFGGLVADDMTLGMGDQTRQICAKLDKLLAAAGSDKTKLLTAQIYVTDMGGKNDMNTAWLEWLDDAHLPSRATIGVASLGSPETLIEVVVTAST
ncbi:RidA family protein [Fodinicurvata sp. EGI_FJ10296]|jgi:enamine deaminase RidA (YjgF/YER057c/UK114 family)|uniref:RidA family protein n=1 Tax=Fodinicurvata sp. EGI_FJ10296 TaxID=3231908 RepID=UPI003454365A